MTDLLAGRVDMLFANSAVGVSQVNAGKVRALAVTSAKRLPLMPDLPTVAEAGVPGYEAVQWFGILAPAGTPREIVSRLHRDLVQVMRDEDTKKRFAADGADPVFSKTPEEFAAFMRAELAKWAKVVKGANIEQQ